MQLQRYSKVITIMVMLSLCACGLALVAPMTGCYVPDYKADVEDILDRWLDMRGDIVLVLHTPDLATMNTALRPIVSKLRDLRHEAAAMDVPDCAQEAHALLLESFDIELEAYTAYLAGNRTRGERLWREAGDVGLDWSRAHCNLSPTQGRWLTFYSGLGH